MLIKKVNSNIDLVLLSIFYLSTLFVAFRIPSLSISYYPLAACIIFMRLLYIKGKIKKPTLLINKKIQKLFLIAIGLLLITTVFSINKVVAIKQFIKISIYILFFFYGSHVLEEVENRKKISKLFIILIVLISILGFYEYFYPRSELFSSLRTEISLYASPRISSILQWPIQYGLILILTLYMLLNYYQLKALSKIILITSTIMQIELCQSRNVYMTLMFLSILILIFHGDWRKPLLITCLFIVSFFLIPNPKDRFSRESYKNLGQNEKVSSHQHAAISNLSKRVRLWEQGFKDLNLKRFLLGIGLDNFRVVINPLIEKKENKLNAHNIFLSVFFELGFFSLILFLLAYFHALKNYLYTKAIYPLSLFIFSQLFDFFIYDPFFNFSFIVCFIILKHENLNESSATF